MLLEYEDLTHEEKAELAYSQVLELEKLSKKYFWLETSLDDRDFNVYGFKAYYQKNNFFTEKQVARIKKVYEDIMNYKKTSQKYFENCTDKGDLIKIVEKVHENFEGTPGRKGTLTRMLNQLKNDKDAILTNKFFTKMSWYVRNHLEDSKELSKYNQLTNAFFEIYLQAPRENQ